MRSWMLLLALALPACGGDDDVPASASVPATPRAAPAAAAPLTVDDLLLLRDLGYDEDRIRDEVRRTRTRLVLDARDVAKLRAAGFSGAFVAFVQGRGPAGETPGPAQGTSAPPPGTSAPPPGTSAPPPGAGALPAGFERAPGVAGTGEVVIRRGAAASATDQLADAFARLRGYFDDGPWAERALRDKGDRQAQATFFGTCAGHRVSGLALSAVDEGKGTIGLAFDRLGAARHTLPDLVARLRGSVGDAAAPDAADATDVALHTVRFSDGSGSVGLPDGWKLVHAGEGAVDITGPHDASLSLGGVSVVWTPAGTIDPATGTRLPVPIVAEYAPPARALAVVFPQINALVRAQVPGVPEARFLRVIAQRPARLPNWDQAAWIHWEHTLGDDVQQAFSLIGVTPSTPQMWMFYVSSASAQKERFDRMLPLMMRIWGSWRISQRELAGRLRRAREAQEDAIRIVDQVVRHRDRVFDEIHAKWIEYIRDEATIRDVETGENRTVDVAAGDARDWVDAANHVAGFERWEVLNPTRINGRE